MPGKGNANYWKTRRRDARVESSKIIYKIKSLEFGIIHIFSIKTFSYTCTKGATPKDGPSAGVGMVTSIISAITETPVNKNVAMTGEITLRD